MADPPAVGFELRFARSARADAAAEPRQRVARSDQPRHQVLELRELDLQLAFPRSRAPREDVEDQLRAIDDLAIERLFEVAQLRRRELVVEDDEVDRRFVARGRRASRPCRCRETSPDPASRAPAARAGTASAPAAAASPASSSSECSGSKCRGESLKRPTSAARSRITRAILARGPTAIAPGADQPERAGRRRRSSTARRRASAAVDQRPRPAAPSSTSPAVDAAGRRPTGSRWSR